MKMVTKPKANLAGFDTHKNITGIQHFLIPPKASV